MKTPPRLFVAFAVLSITAPAAARLDENSVCGAIASGQLTIPSYRFNITDQRGNHVANLTGRGNLVITEGVWRGHWYEGQWDEEHHDVALSVTYDASRSQYVSAELPSLTITRRRKGLGPFKTTCWDRVRTLTFSFQPPASAEPAIYGGQFVFHLPNKPVAELGLPDPNTPINIVVKDKR